MTNRLTTKSKVLCPMLMACVARDWLPCISAPDRRSWTAERLVSPKRSSSLTAHAGRAWTTCWKYRPKLSSPDLILSYAPATSPISAAPTTVTGKMTMTMTMFRVTSAASARRPESARPSRRFSGANTIAMIVPQRIAPDSGHRIHAKARETTTTRSRNARSLRTGASPPSGDPMLSAYRQIVPLGH